MERPFLSLRASPRETFLSDSTPGQQESKETFEDFRKLLGPLVHETLRDQNGALDLAKVRAKDFNEFKKFLADQAGLNPTVGVHFLYIDTVPYKKLLQEERFLPLLKILYQQINPNEFVSLPDSEAHALLKDFQREIIAIDAKAFAQSKLSSPEGRSSLSALLSHPGELSDGLRADLIRGVTYAMKDQGRLSDFEYGQVARLSPLGCFQVLDFFSLLDSKEGLDPATKGALSLIESAAFFEKEAEEKKADFQARPWLNASLSIGGKFQSLDPERIAHFEKLKEEMSSQADLVSRAQGELAELWLMAANRRHWDASLVGKDVDAVRSHTMKGAEEFIRRAEKLETRREFEDFVHDLKDFLEAEVDPKHSNLNSSLQTLIQKLPSGERGAFDRLKHHIDTWCHSIEMGEWITVGKVEIKFRDDVGTPLAAPDSAGTAPRLPAGSLVGGRPMPRREDVLRMIQGLEQTKHDLWYGYKQHKVAARIGSAIMDGFEAGDREDIRAANREINQMIHRLSEAESVEDIVKVRDQFASAMEKGGALFKGIDASRMDFNEQLIGLGQTITIMAAMGLATRGLSLLGQSGVALLRSAGVLRAASAAETATAVAATTAETATVGERVVRGFQLGAQISLAENAVAVASGEVRQGPETVGGWAKDALATGTSMAFTGLLPVSHAAKGNLLKNVWGRYTANTAQGIKFLAMDTATEAIEEGIENVARRAMDNDFMPVDPTQANNILALSFAGGGAKVGTAAEIIKGTKQETRSGKQDEISVRRHPLTNPIFAPALMLLGAEGAGGSGIISTKDDPHLRNLEASLRDLQDKNPDDPAIQNHYQVIADYLQELGDPRGDLIALELKRQKLLSENAKRVRRVEKEIHDIRNKIYFDIREQFGLGVDYTFNPMKGFQLRFSLFTDDSPTADSFARFLKSGYASFLTGLKLSDFNEYQDWLLTESNLKYLTGLRELEISHSPDYVANHLHALLQSPSLSRLRTLSLRGNGLGDGEVRRIAASPTSQHLQSLDLWGNNMTSEGAMAIAESPHLARLQSLNLRGNNIRIDARLAIRHSLNLPNLIELNGEKIDRGQNITTVGPLHVVDEADFIEDEEPPPSSDSAGRAHAWVGPAAFPIIETLLNGQPSATGMLLGGLTMLASSGMVLGIFSRMAEWVKGKWSGDQTRNSDDTFALGFTSDSHPQSDTSAGEQEENFFGFTVELQETPCDLDLLFSEFSKDPLFQSSYLCWDGAELLAEKLAEKGIASEKIWVFGGKLQQKWAEHVATVVKVKNKEGVVQRMVLDPQISPRPLLIMEWLSKVRVDGKQNFTHSGWPVRLSDAAFFNPFPHIALSPSDVYHTASNRGDRVYLSSIADKNNGYAVLSSTHNGFELSDLEIQGTGEESGGKVGSGPAGAMGLALAGIGSGLATLLGSGRALAAAHADLLEDLSRFAHEKPGFAAFVSLTWLVFGLLYFRVRQVLKESKALRMELFKAIFPDKFDLTQLPEEIKFTPEDLKSFAQKHDSRTYLKFGRRFTDCILQEDTWFGPLELPRGTLVRFNQDGVAILAVKSSAHEEAFPVTENRFQELKHDALEQLRQGFLTETGETVHVVESMKNFPLGELESTHPWVGRFLEEHPELRDLEVTDVEINVDPNASLKIRNFKNEVEKRTAASLMGLDLLVGGYFGEVGQMIHPQGSRRYRHFPLQFLLWAERQLPGGGVVEPEFLSEMPSLDGVRDLLEKGKWPMTLFPEGSSQKSKGLFGSRKVHHAAVDDYWEVTHDLYHLRRWNQFGPELGPILRQDMVLIYDSFKKALSALPKDLQEKEFLLDAQDLILSGPSFDYGDGNYRAVFTTVNFFFKEAAVKGYLESTLKEELAASFRRHLAEDLKGHPRAEKILSEFDAGFGID